MFLDENEEAVLAFSKAWKPRYMNLLTGWLHIPAENFELQAEVAFAP